MCYTMILFSCSFYLPLTMINLKLYCDVSYQLYNLDFHPLLILCICKSCRSNHISVSVAIIHLCFIFSLTVSTGPGISGCNVQRQSSYLFVFLQSVECVRSTWTWTPCRRESNSELRPGLETSCFNTQKISIALFCNLILVNQLKYIFHITFYTVLNLNHF